MSKSKERKVNLSDEEKKLAIEKLIHYFDKERDEEIGNLAAMLLLEFFLDEIGPALYNQGISDAQKYISDKAEDLYGLMK